MLQDIVICMHHPEDSTRQDGIALAIRIEWREVVVAKPEALVVEGHEKQVGPVKLVDDLLAVGVAIKLSIANGA